MTTEKTGQKDEREEKCAAMDCCSPQQFGEMMAKRRDEMKRNCCAMMKGECRQPGQQ